MGGLDITGGVEVMNAVKKEGEYLLRELLHLCFVKTKCEHCQTVINLLGAAFRKSLTVQLMNFCRSYTMLYFSILGVKFKY